MMLVGSATSHGAVQLIQFQPNPVSPTLPEFSWTGPGGNFVDNTGSHSDGTAGVPGLQIDTPLVVAAPVTAGETIDAFGSHFRDAAITLSSSTNLATFQDTGAGILGGQWFQTLTNGSFTITATDGTVLLTGNVSGNFFGSSLASSSAGFNGGTVAYTGGLIYNALVASGGVPTGDMSVSMTKINNTGNPSNDAIGVTQTGPVDPFGQAPATVSAFDADATGVFDVLSIPEPASLGVLAVVGLFLPRRRA